MSLELNFKKSNEKHQFVLKHDNILIACSGGMDSMSLCDLFIQLGFSIGIVHVDHGTRNGQSSLDSDFVRKYAEKNNLPFYCKAITQDDYESSTKNNFHAFARSVRYSFFEEISNQYDYNKIATAHHKDDSLESVLMNFIRGTGLSGLSGIKSNNHIIRPFIDISKKDIINYTESNDISFHEDSSNQESVYRRNFLRNKLIPILNKYNPNALKGIHQTINNLKESERFIQEKLNDWKTENLIQKSDYIELSTDSFNEDSKFHLFYLYLKLLGFNKSQATEIRISTQKGKRWLSKDYVIFHEAKYLTIIKNKHLEKIKKIYKFNEFIEPINGSLCVSENTNSLGKILRLCNSIKIKDITIRTWNKGDFMITPYGKKKVNKIFNELQLNTIEKRRAILVTTESNVLWIVNKKKGFCSTNSSRFIELIT